QYDMFGAQGGGPELFPFGDFGDLFDVFFGGGVGSRRRGGGRRRSRVQRGEDLLVELSLTFEEAAFGGQHDVTVDTLVGCSRCSLPRVRGGGPAPNAPLRGGRGPGWRGRRHGAAGVGGGKRGPRGRAARGSVRLAPGGAASRVRTSRAGPGVRAGGANDPGGP